MSETGHSACPTQPNALRDNCGAVAIEYALLAALMALAIIASLTQLGDTLVNLPLAEIVNAVDAVLD